MKTISVLFTCYHDWFAGFLRKIRGQEYSHVSVSVSRNRTAFYSFNFKGLVRETLQKFRRHKVRDSMLYEIPVPDNIYDTVKRKLETIKRRRKRMHYAFLGIFFCCLGIPFHRKNRYFCSEFVAELLKSSHVLPLQKHAASYLPNQLRLELDRYFGDKKTVNVV